MLSIRSTLQVCWPLMKVKDNVWKELDKDKKPRISFSWLKLCMKWKVNVIMLMLC